MKKIQQLEFNNTYSRLPDGFFSVVNPTPLTQPHMISVNTAVAELLELDVSDLHEPDNLAYLCGQALHEGMQPLAQCYAGHQFGGFVPRLGDGRAILLGEVVTTQNGKWDLQIKGSGLTPYSRDGDGRAVLRSTIREYLCSEAMHGLGIPTTRALCMIGSEQEVYREQIEKGAMLLRTAPSHVRFGTFEYFYYSNRHEDVEQLLDFVIQHHYPELADADNPGLALLQQVVERTAEMIAQWQAVGFAHGVMNTDNMSVLGLTMDYGPFGFLDAYEPGYICNHSDYQGRYAFDQQPNIGLFNLSCFAQALLPALGSDVDAAVAAAKQALEQYQSSYTAYYAQAMRAKLGLEQADNDDQAIVQDLLGLMAEDKVDYTILFRRLCEFSTEDGADNHALRDLFIQREQFDQWAARYRQRLASEALNDQQRASAMRSVNPAYVLRNYMAEHAIRLAESEQDYSEIERLLSLLQDPFTEQAGCEHYAGLPPDWAQQISVSCSS